ncbi:hypothetical protein [Bacillus sp. FJAT-49736]|uniref:hypothetical protein n=1 Tax=Bacillus sp. FJAT-49736 TaxID=2833582 RepID=UPI001BC9FAFA|nr:hypothetical protein [Bacillus sp. FJAT-49736]MBS4174284.1 hypothetical protein [Bacillus sp. FJAT-49736]
MNILSNKYGGEDIDMELIELISEINDSMERYDLVTARIYIEENIELLSENKHRLKGNSSKVLDFLTDESNQQPLNRDDFAIISKVNLYASEFDVSGIRIVLKNNIALFLKEDVLEYLNSDAKIILESMGTI